MKEDSKLKHLEFIQAIISRQASNSFQAKSWTIISLAGLAGLSRGEKADVLLISAGVVVVFWLLDAFYLSKERVYRNMYERIAVKGNFNMSLKPIEKDRDKCTKMYRTMTAWVVILPYGSMIVAILTITLRG